MKLGYLSTLKTVGTLSTKIAIVAAASIGGASLVSSSVFAALTASATNTSATAVSSGYMSLTQASGGASGGFTTAITAMAPLDSVVRLVTLTNASTLNAASMTVAVSDATPTVLTTNGTTGLQTSIQQCTVAYTAVTYACSGTETTVRAASSLLSLATPQALTLIPASLLASGVTYLKVTISLPDSTDNTLNGVIPAGIQNKSAALTWTIAATQRTATTTNS